MIIAFLLVIKIESQNTYQEIFNNSPACKNGRIQSPILLSDVTSKYDQESIVTSVNYNSLNDIYVNFNERILKVFQNDNSQPNFGNVNYRKRGYLSNYQLIDIEFYYPGEHRIQEGNNIIVPDIEVKLIHKKNLKFSSTTNFYRNFTEPNSYLIISLLYKQNYTLNSDNGFLTNLISLYNPSKSPMMMKNIDFDSFDLIKNNRYFMYDGSFSYFPCDENVSYMVVRDIYDINDNTIQNIIGKYNIKYPNPQVNKTISEPYGRPVYRNYILNSSNYLKNNVFYILILLFLILF